MTDSSSSEGDAGLEICGGGVLDPDDDVEMSSSTTGVLVRPGGAGLFSGQSTFPTPNLRAGSMDYGSSKALIPANSTSYSNSILVSR